ncbi:MAG: chemotaxis-specific protein-glutamate methyltransferase CheB [Promethearchaeota archaeon]
MSIKILIADDSAYLRKAISDILKENKSIEIVDNASNGVEAINMVKEYNPDVLILDLLMPKMNGLEAFKFIINEIPTPTIILSSISPKNMGASVQALLLGAFDYVIKPGGLGAKSLPEFRKQLLEKVIAASKSQIKKVYDKNNVFNRKSSFRQEIVSETFEFGKYLNKLEPIQDSEKSEVIKVAIVDKIKEKPKDKEDLKKQSIILDIKSQPLIEKENKIVSKKTEIKEKKLIKKSKIEEIPKKSLQEKLKTPKIKIAKKPPEILVKNPVKAAEQKIKTKTPIKISKIVKKKVNYVPSLTPIKDIQLSSNIIVIGASVGGPRTLKNILKNIPQNIPSPILIVQHLSGHFIDTLAQTLNATCNVKIKIAQDKEPIKPGVVYIAPGEKHMEISVVNKNPCIKLSIGPAVHFCIPSIDVLFYSAARIYGNRTMGILLTGMGEDGVDGLGAIKKIGGKTIAESERTCVLYGMPKFAAQKGYADLILPNYEIKDYLVNFAKYKR